MLRGDLQKPVNSRPEARRILLPRQIVQEYAHAVQADGFGPSQFPVDPLWIECFLLPHLEFVDRGCRNVIATDNPRLLRIPLRRFLFRPTTSGALGRCASTESSKKQRNQRTEFCFTHVPSSGELDGRAFVQPGAQGARASPRLVVLSSTSIQVMHFPHFPQPC